MSFLLLKRVGILIIQLLTFAKVIFFIFITTIEIISEKTKNMARRLYIITWVLLEGIRTSVSPATITIFSGVFVPKKLKGI